MPGAVQQPVQSPWSDLLSCHQDEGGLLLPHLRQVAADEGKFLRKTPGSQGQGIPNGDHEYLEDETQRCPAEHGGNLVVVKALPEKILIAEDRETNLPRQVRKLLR